MLIPAADTNPSEICFLQLQIFTGFSESPLVPSVHQSQQVERTPHPPFPLPPPEALMLPPAAAAAVICMRGRRKVGGGEEDLS